jgi:hypothetical protein
MLGHAILIWIKSPIRESTGAIRVAYKTHLHRGVAWKFFTCLYNAKNIRARELSLLLTLPSRMLEPSSMDLLWSRLRQLATPSLPTFFGWAFVGAFFGQAFIKIFSSRPPLGAFSCHPYPEAFSHWPWSRSLHLSTLFRTLVAIIYILSGSVRRYKHMLVSHILCVIHLP